MTDIPEHGLALLTDASGMITHVHRNDLDLRDAVPGRLLIRLVENASRIKAMRFLASIKENDAAFDWELNVTQDDGATTLHFSGGQTGDQLLIVGATNGKVAAQLYEDMVRINNEQTNLLRATLKERQRVNHDNLDGSLYDEISRLNNELVAMQRELAKKNAELERLNQEKNRFLGMAAHDLRNPLHGILMQSEFLLEMIQDSTYHEFLQNISTYSQFMANLVDDLLDVAKIEAGQLNLELWPTDIEALVTRNVTLNQLLADRKQTVIELSVEPMPQAVVDAAKIEQVLNNLIGNAVKFSPPASRVRVKLSRKDANFQVEIRDQGPGISPEEQESLFRPFQRGKVRGTAGESSTGLGLMIAKRIVVGHGGNIWLESAPGKGTTFFVSIPFQPLTEEGAAS